MTSNPWRMWISERWPSFGTGDGALSSVEQIPAAPGGAVWRVGRACNPGAYAAGLISAAPAGLGHPGRHLLPPSGQSGQGFSIKHDAKGLSEESEILFDQSLVHRLVLRVKLVEKLNEQTVTATALELRADGYVDLGRETLILPLELLNQVLVEGYGYLAFGWSHTRSVPG